MARLVLELPDEVLERLRTEAEQHQTTVEAFVTSQLTSASPRILNPDGTLSASALYDAGGTGPGTHGSAKAVDQYLRELRAEWE